VHLRGLLSNPPKTVDNLLRALERADGRSQPVRVRVAQRKIEKPNHKLTPDEIDLLIAAYTDGASLSQLGQQFGIHRQTAKAHLERRGVTIRPEANSLSDERLDLAAQFYAEGHSTAAIGSRLEVHASTIARALQRRGVLLRSRGRSTSGRSLFREGGG
jgi:DNA-binding CsgD family transcriptional regulator